MKTRTLIPLASLCLSLAAGAAYAQALPQHGTAAMSASAHLGVGVVRGIDAKARTITIAHQAINTLGMTAMTMPFRVDETLPLAGIKRGQTVAFVLTEGAQGMTVTSLQPVAGSAAKPADDGSHDMHATAMMDHCREMMTRK